MKKPKVKEDKEQDEADLKDRKKSERKLTV